jgi:hypothetical protein
VPGEVTHAPIQGIIVLFAAVLYGWLYVFGVIGLRGSHRTGALTPAQRSA